MQLVGTISVEEAKDLSTVHFSQGSRMHLLVPAAFFVLVLILLLGFEYYNEWKRKRRLNRYWEQKRRSRT